MKEGEARQKTCPIILIVGMLAKREDGSPIKGSECNCIASDCMMWRWERGASPEDRRDRIGYGFCGLGDKP